MAAAILICRLSQSTPCMVDLPIDKLAILGVNLDEHSIPWLTIITNIDQQFEGKTKPTNIIYSWIGFVGKNLTGNHGCYHQI